MKKKTAEEAATVGDVERRVAALKREIKQLVHLVGEDDEGVGAEAVHAFSRVAELIAGPVAAAIKRPRSRLHRLRLVFLARLLGTRGTLQIQQALYEVTKIKGDDRLASSAAVVLGELLDDEMEMMANVAHRAGRRERGSAVVDPMSIDQQGA
jgi:hypothetical protein